MIFIKITILISLFMFFIFYNHPCQLFLRLYSCCLLFSYVERFIQVLGIISFTTVLIQSFWITVTPQQLLASFLSLKTTWFRIRNIYSHKSLYFLLVKWSGNKFMVIRSVWKNILPYWSISLKCCLHNVCFFHLFVSVVDETRFFLFFEFINNSLQNILEFLYVFGWYVGKVLLDDFCVLVFSIEDETHDKVQAFSKCRDESKNYCVLVSNLFIEFPNLLYLFVGKLIPNDRITSHFRDQKHHLLYLFSILYFHIFESVFHFFVHALKGCYCLFF